jgi:hypothetical protein
MRQFVWFALALLLSSTIQGAPQTAAPDVPAMHRLWSVLKSQLTAPNGQEWFDQNLRDSELPYLHATFLSSGRKDGSTVLQLALSDKTTSEVELTIDSGLVPEGLGGGAEVMFRGVATAFAGQPFRLSVEATHLARMRDSK